jgi:choline dehydrogenase
LKSPRFIIIGAGTAGCALANRLSEDRVNEVMLIETGKRARGWKIDMPAALAYPIQDKQLNWGYHTDPQPHLNGRSIHWPRGRGLGGSSLINGMVYVRGHPLDYERWEAEGAAGWGWRNVLPYFRKCQAHVAGADAYRGAHGPLAVAAPPLANPLYRAWIEAGRQAGYAVSQDLNGFRQDAFGPLDLTAKNGERWSADKAYLREAESRPNLRVITDALVHRIIVRGSRAAGVSFSVNGEMRSIDVEGEVILCAGAINSPQLLQLSGIGDPAHLRSLDVEVEHELPGVGRNLQDHLCVYVQHACLTRDSLAEVLKQPRKTLAGLRWLLLRKGIGASNQFEAGAFIRSAAGIEHPDVQYHFMPLAVGYEHLGSALAPSFQVDADALRPSSRGSVMIRSKDSCEAPAIDPNYLAEESDRTSLRNAVKLAREIFAQAAFDRYRGKEIAPGDAVSADHQIDSYIRDTAESAYHPSCTCRMGTDAEAVVDPDCRVRGLEGLRVVDASVMPSIVSGNLNAPTFMIAERAADIILGHKPLPPESPPFFVSASWQHQQR